MRTLTVVAAILGLAAAGAAQAQEPLLNRVVQSNWLRCSIVGGRVAVDGTRLGSMRSNTRGLQRNEVLNVRNENGQFTLSYERTTSQDQIQVEVAAADDRVLIRRTPRASSPILPIEFSQVPNEKITLKLGSGAEQKVFRAPDMWQLLIAQPNLCKEHLLPLLEMLRPNWKLAETAAGVEEQLLREAGGNGASGRALWSTLVTQLGDENFAKREAADRALRTGTANTLAYLRQLDFGRLDAEQQFRIRRIIEAFAGQNGEDSAEQATASLAAEPTVWLALLERPEQATRQTAARQLATLLGEPIAVDPVADPVTQKEQREQLRTRIEGK
jgi:hypothetical protein